MTLEDETRHIGLDLGATNLEWAVVAHAGSAWTTEGRPRRLVDDLARARDDCGRPAT